MRDESWLRNEIRVLKEEKNALILAHMYQPLAIQRVADRVSDSFDMAKLASHAPERLVVVCGVRFMAESAKILSPEKKILNPAPDAVCPMADMVTPEDVRRLRREHPGALVMCYVNSSAAVKAESDVCCTSSSAVRIARAAKEQQIIFIPDKNLGEYIARQVPEKEVILFNGCCPVHDRIRAEDVLAAKALHPEAKVAVHPECPAEVVALADFVGSTTEILAYVEQGPIGDYVIGTELEVTRRLRQDVPESRIYSLREDFVCADMKKNTLEQVLECLRTESPETTVPQREMELARRALERMIQA